MAGEQRDVTPDEALIHSWLGDYGFGEPDDQDEDPLGRDLEYRPGESSVVHVDDPATRARAEAEIAALHPGDPQLTHFDSRPIDPGAFDDWLASASLAAVAGTPP